MKTTTTTTKKKIGEGRGRRYTNVGIAFIELAVERFRPRNDVELLNTPDLQATAFFNFFFFCQSFLLLKDSRSCFHLLPLTLYYYCLGKCAAEGGEREREETHAFFGQRCPTRGQGQVSTCQHEQACLYEAEVKLSFQKRTVPYVLNMLDAEPEAGALFSLFKNSWLKLYTSDLDTCAFCSQNKGLSIIFLLLLLLFATTHSAAFVCVCACNSVACVPAPFSFL